MGISLMNLSTFMIKCGFTQDEVTYMVGALSKLDVQIEFQLKGFTITDAYDKYYQTFGFSFLGFPKSLANKHEASEQFNAALHHFFGPGALDLLTGKQHFQHSKNCNSLGKFGGIKKIGTSVNLAGMPKVTAKPEADLNFTSYLFANLPATGYFYVSANALGVPSAYLLDGLGTTYTKGPKDKEWIVLAKMPIHLPTTKDNEMAMPNSMPHAGDFPYFKTKAGPTAVEKAAAAIKAQNAPSAMDKAIQKLKDAPPLTDLTIPDAKKLQAVALKDAKYIGQPVFGASSSSRYFVVMLGTKMNLAARLEGGIKLHVRAEFKGSTPASSLILKGAGFQDKGGYWSVHMLLGGVPVVRVLGALLMELGDEVVTHVATPKEVDLALA